MKYALGLLLTLMLVGCSVPKDYYRFQVRTFLYKQKTPKSGLPDSSLVLNAIVRVDSSELLPHDWKQLEKYTKENRLVLKTEKQKIIVEKYRKSSENISDVATETKTNASDLRKMKYLSSNPTKWFGKVLLLVALGIGLAFLLLYLLIAAAIDASADAFGCYIATVCYGNGNAPEVVALRAFRDQVMRKYFIGRVLVGTYYLISPSIAKYLQGKGRVNFCIRKLLLDPIVFTVRKYMVIPPG